MRRLALLIPLLLVCSRTPMGVLVPDSGLPGTGHAGGDVVVPPASGGGTHGSGGIGGAGGTTGSSGAYGMSCTTNQDCPPDAVCCDGSDESCDGTRLPAGDGTNSGEFVVSADGLTVTDTTTGLVWQRDGSGTRAGCSGNGTLTCTWAEAKAYCGTLALGGVSGWRLPARMELLTIVDFTKYSIFTNAPSIDPTAFPSTPGEWFWTSSPYAGSSSNAWEVNFYEGSSNVEGLGYYNRVRCVR